MSTVRHSEDVFFEEEDFRLPHKPGYYALAKQPLYSLVLLVPLILLYEIGTILVNTDVITGREYRIVAFNLVEALGALFGLSGPYMPGILCVVILLGWHLATRHGWKLHQNVLLGMLVEAVFLCLPLLLLNRFFTTGYLIPNAAAPPGEWLAEMTFAIGAGLYEELLFRLLFITFANMLLVDVLRGNETLCGLFIVILSALLFAGYHYWPGGEAFNWDTFSFRAIAGLYFGGLFLLRGFGITAATHAAYDIIAVLLSG